MLAQFVVGLSVLANTLGPTKQYEKEGKWVYEQHPFWCTGYTYWDLHSEAPDLFLHLSKSDLVIFKVRSAFTLDLWRD